MKINKIILENFGSYEGINSFNTEEFGNRNIILIGGKNGAGKTTLFIAMRLCLYGYMSMGYKNANAYYSRTIIKMINNSAKMLKPARSSVSLDLNISDGREMNHYILKRMWILSDGLDEQYLVEKNGVLLSENEKGDFIKYLYHLIPPELFNLYFFDGEKIADFFLEEGSNTRIKNAFLTLCGYDTFDIMSKNFKRVYSTTAMASSTALNEYLSAKDTYLRIKQNYDDLQRQIKECADSLSNCIADLDALESSYTQSGGITREAWEEQIATLKLEEKKRESYNAWLKRIANEYLPFVMIRDQIEELEKQLIAESNNKKYDNFCEIIESPLIADALKRLSSYTAVYELESLAHSQYGADAKTILDLSFESATSVLAIVQDVLAFKPEKIVNVKKTLKASISKTARIREVLERSSIETVHIYMEKKTTLLEKKAELLNQQLSLEDRAHQAIIELQNAETVYEKTKASLEDELKRESISDISSKAILMLDKLQEILYHKQIVKIEEFFRKEISVLMRKTRFIDDIRIDDDFNIHLYRTEMFNADRIASILKANTEDASSNGSAPSLLREMQKVTNLSSIAQMTTFIQQTPGFTLSIPVEIDKTLLSNGEKQIFIMALYHSLIQLCNHEIPFVIDTPFARIDTEHRENIAKYFFCQLKGQVFILSTNEEIDSRHVSIMKNKILATYILENSDNKRTTIVQNKYFEEK